MISMKQRQITRKTKPYKNYLKNVQENQHLHSDDWCRTIYINTIGVGTTQFDLDDQKKNLGKQKNDVLEKEKDEDGDKDSKSEVEEHEDVTQVEGSDDFRKGHGRYVVPRWLAVKVRNACLCRFRRANRPASDTWSAPSGWSLPRKK